MSPTIGTNNLDLVLDLDLDLDWEPIGPWWSSRSWIQSGESSVQVQVQV
jgi:hypothetical protein